MRPNPSRPSPSSAGSALLALGLFSACGAGTAGIVAGSNGSSGGSTPALDAFVVEGPKESPSLLRLDASQPVRVGLFFDLGAGEQAMTQLAGVVGNEVDLPAGELPLTWDFASEPGIGTASFNSGVRLLAKRGGTVLSGGELTLGLGNDAPAVLSIDQIDIDPDAGEASGTTGIQLTVADSSDDVVSVKVEFDVQGDVPDAGWQLARPALEDPGLPTPLFGITDVQVQSTGTPLTFFWDTDALTDLKDLEREVRLRFTATDGFLTGAPLASPSFRVDNNAPPIVQLDSGPLILNPDERRGIPISFRVIDEEGDRVEVIFQWRREGEEFPELPRDMAQLDAILADPELRREFRICSEYPRYAQGRVVPIDADTVRLPELASSESWILAGGLEGRTLELLRPSSIPQPITPTWASNPLVSPIAALPVGDGLTALVLDVPGNGRLREIELGTGVVVREIASFGAGLPTTMAFERGEKAVLVALDDAGTWRIERVELAGEAISGLIVSDGTEPAPVHGIASLGTEALVFTAGSSLFHLDYRDLVAPQLGTVLTDLATPWGVVVDPLPPNQIYVSERDANRVLVVELDSHGKLPVVVKTADLQPAHLERPSALALERNGSRMLIVTNEPGGTSQLVGLDLGAEGRNVCFPIGPSRASEIASIGSGPEELRCATLPGDRELLIGGGLEQRRVLVAYDNARQEATLDVALDPEARPDRAWRISADMRPQLASPTGLDAAFVWSSGQDIGAGPAFLLAIARDDELGLATEGRAPKQVQAGLDVAPLGLGGTAFSNPISVAAADLDGDGDQDLVSANQQAHNLTVFFQGSPGSFAAAPLVLGGFPITNGPTSVAAADLDGDGDQDLVSANAGDLVIDDGGSLTVFFQESPGSFGAAPLVLGGLGPTFGPVSVAAADLDGDGDQDLVSATRQGNTLVVFFQASPGSFASVPLVLGGPASTITPMSVAAADLDGDGDLDLVSANASGNLTVFFQGLPGSFASAPLVLGGPAITSSPRSVATADLDGDGDQDLVSANLVSNSLTIFFQGSPGNFAAVPLVLGGPALSTPIYVAAADLDGDGDQDLVSANQDGSNLTVFFQSSPGGFAAAPLVLGGPAGTSFPISVAAADLDGDGDQDLVSANYSGNNLTVFFQGSLGSFAAAPLVLGGPAVTGSCSSVAAADLDGDGDQDLVSANAADVTGQSGNNLTVFFQSSPGSWASAPLVLGGPTRTRRPVSVAAADLDGDGDQDLVSANQDGNNLTVFFQSSPGSWASAPLVLGGPTRTRRPVSVAAADLDGDGDQDLVSANFTGANLTVFFQRSPGGFAAGPLVLGSPAITNAPVSIAAADLDGDGDQDLVSANQNGDNLTVFFQGSLGNFAAAPLVLGGDAITDLPSSVAAADLDADGDQDLVSANRPSSTLTVFFQGSPGSFAATPLVLGGHGITDFPLSVTAADLDDDGDQDLVSANAGFLGDTLTVFFQGSPGSFAAAPLVLGGPASTGFPSSVAAADLDGDGEQDLVSANQLSGTLTVFFGGR